MPRRISIPLMVLGLTASPAAVSAATATADAGVEFLYYGESCELLPGEDYPDGTLDVFETGDFTARASIESGPGRDWVTDTGLGSVTMVNNTRTAVCDIFSAGFVGGLTADLEFPDAFEDVGPLQALAMVTISGHQSLFRELSITSAEFSPPYPPSPGYIDGFYIETGLRLWPGDSVSWNVEVVALATTDPLPLPPAAVLLAGGLAGLAGLGRLRRR